MSESADEQGEDRIIIQRADVTDGKAIQAARDVIYREIHRHYRTDPNSAEAALPVEWLTHVSTRLLGREADFTALAAALDPGRDGPHTVLLTTPRFVRGVGRTSLARGVAQHARDQGWYPGGIYYADARSETPDTPVDTVRFCPMLLTVALGVDVAELPGERNEQMALYKQEFAERTEPEQRTLIIIDGALTHEQIDSLHPNGDHRVLVIPNQHLENVHEASEIRIGPLDLPNAVALLRDAVGSANGHFTGVENRHRLERVASLVGGSPRSLTSIAHYIAANPSADVSDVARTLVEHIDSAQGPADDEPLIVEVVHDLMTRGPFEFGAAVGLTGREAIVQWITDDWLAGRPARWEIVGGSGYGKSTLFKRLADRLRLDGGAIILASGDALARSLGEASSTADSDILPFCRATVAGIATDLEGSVPSETFEGLLKIGHEGVSPAAMLKGSGAILSAHITGTENPLRFAFLIDNLDGLSDARCRSWLLELATELGCPLAVSLHPGATSGIQTALRLPLTPLNAHHLAQAENIPSELATRIVDATRGHPSDIALLLNDVKADPDNADVRIDQYEVDVRNEGVTAARLVRARATVDRISRTTIGRPEAELQLLDLLAVLRRFDEETVSALLAEHDLDEDGVDRLMDGLRGCPLITDVNEYGEYELHALYREAHLEHMSGGHRRRLHRRAEKVIFGRLAEYEPDTSSKYIGHASWSKYEDPFWGIQILEWFHHAAHGYRSAIGHDTLIRLALLYFEAFWWFGSYAGLSVCDEIVRDAERITAARTTSDIAWAKAIGDVNANYPRGWNIAATPEAWRDVAAGLRHLLGKTTPVVHADRAGDEAGQLAMYLNDYLADCAHYSSDSVSGTAASYRDAARRLARTVLSDDNAWIPIWFDLFDAETCLDRGDTRVASQYLNSMRSTENPDKNVDYEVRCRYELAMARLANDTSRPREAVRHASAAVLRAYVYNVFQETSQQSPSLYTRMLQEECLDNLTRALEQTRGATRASAVAEIQRYFEPYWRERVRQGRVPEGTVPLDSATPAEIVGHFVPAPPTDGEIGFTRTGFTACVEVVKEAMAGELDWPPLQARLPRQRGWNPRRAISVLLHRG